MGLLQDHLSRPAILRFHCPAALPGVPPAARRHRVGPGALRRFAARISGARARPGTWSWQPQARRPDTLRRQSPALCRQRRRAELGPADLEAASGWVRRPAGFGRNSGVPPVWRALWRAGVSMVTRPSSSIIRQAGDEGSAGPAIRRAERCGWTGQPHCCSLAACVASPALRRDPRSSWRCCSMARRRQNSNQVFPPCEHERAARGLPRALPPWPTRIAPAWGRRGPSARGARRGATERSWLWQFILMGAEVPGAGCRDATASLRGWSAVRRGQLAVPLITRTPLNLIPGTDQVFSLIAPAGLWTLLDTFDELTGNCWRRRACPSRTAGLRARKRWSAGWPSPTVSATSRDGQDRCWVR